MITFKVVKNHDVTHLIRLDRYIKQEEPNIIDLIDEDMYMRKFQEQPIENQHTNDIILCFIDSEVVGRIDLMYETSYIDFSKVGYIDWIYVRKDYRNKGIGKQLLSEADKLFKKQDCFKYFLFVANNDTAKLFYKTSGLKLKTMKTAQKIFNKDN